MSVPFLIIFDKLADGDTLVMRDHLQSFHVFLMSRIKFFNMVDLSFLVQYALRKLIILLIYPSSFPFLVGEVKRAFSLWTANGSDALKLHRRSRPIQLIFLFL